MKLDFISMILGLWSLYICLVIVKAQENTDKKELYLPFVTLKGKITGDYYLPTNTQLEKDKNGDLIFEDSKHHGANYLCPADNPKLIEKIRAIDDKTILHIHCLFDIKFDVTQARICTREVQPLILTTGKICGSPENMGLLYEFGFLICEMPIFLDKIENKSKIDGETFLENVFKPKNNRKIMYQFCYSHRTRNVSYVTYNILSPLLLKNYKWEFSGNESQTKSTNDFGLFENRFEQMAAEYEELPPEKILHMMIPSTHMAFGSWRKTVHHYANIKPMSKEVKKIWDFVDDRIKSKAEEFKTEYEIYMRSEEDENETVWLKIVYDSYTKSGVAIVVHEKEQLGFSPYCYEGQETVNFIKYDGMLGLNEKLVFFCKLAEKHFNSFGIQKSKMSKFSYLDLDILDSRPLSAQEVIFGRNEDYQ